MTKQSCFWISIFLFIASCSSSDLNRQNRVTGKEFDEPVYTVYLIGDAGAATLNPKEPILEVLREHIMQTGERSTVIFLGDNIYPDGLPPEGAENRQQAETRILSQLETVKDYPGRVIFIPGNHDWYSSQLNGLEWLNRQEEFIEFYLNRGNVFIPDNGLPGPVSVMLAISGEHSGLNFDIRLIALDTHWWLHPHEKPLEPGIESEHEQKREILKNVEKMVQGYLSDEIMVVTHHPLFSYGRHGGKFPISTHFLPPVFGSMYVAYRNIWGYAQDIARYDDLKNGLLKSIDDKDGLIFASGHEHSLQFIPYKNGPHIQYQLVSGSASKPSFVKEKSGDVATYRGEGFIAVHFFRNKTKKIEFWNEEGFNVYQRIVEAND